MNGCPSAEQLQAWLTNRLSGTQAEGVAAHVEGCDHCQQVLEELTAAQGRNTAAPGAQIETSDSGSPSVSAECDEVLLRRLAQKFPSMFRFQQPPAVDSWATSKMR
jgi:hypothetical protein